MSQEEQFKELRMFSLEKRKFRRDVHESYLKLSEELSWERWVRFISKAKRAGLGLGLIQETLSLKPDRLGFKP